MDSKYKITVRGYDYELEDYTDATEQVWWRTNEKFTIRELLEKHGKEMPLFDCSSEDLEVSIYEDHFTWDNEKQERVPGGIRDKLPEQAWAGEVYASFEEVW